jgi:hypothetical protein
MNLRSTAATGLKATSQYGSEVLRLCNSGTLDPKDLGDIESKKYKEK